MSFIHHNFELGSGLEEMQQFLTTTSPFYPELEALYQQRIEVWAAEITDEEEESYV